jgi:hypothetical protein
MKVTLLLKERACFVTADIITANIFIRDFLAMTVSATFLSMTVVFQIPGLGQIKLN